MSRRLRFGWTLCVALLIAALASPQDEGGAPRDSNDEAKASDDARTSPNLPRQIGLDFKTVFSRKENLVIVGVGAGTAWASSYLDDELAEHFSSREADESGAGHAIFEAGSVLGGAAVQAGAAFATYGIGKLTSKPGVEALGRDLVRAQIVAQSLTFVLKRVARRERPDGSNERSFPSGHSASAFATAAVLQRHYGSNLGIPAYIVASYVAMSRVSEAKHYLSDIVFGAAIGILSGRSVTVDVAKNRFAVSPLLVPAGAGIQFTWLGAEPAGR